MTSFIAACGSGRSTSFIPAVPAAWSVTTIAFMMFFSSVICLFGGNVAALESPFDISCQGPWVASESEGGTALCQWSACPRLPGLHQRELLDALPLPQQVTRVRVEAVGAVVDLRDAQVDQV